MRRLALAFVMAAGAVPAAAEANRGCPIRMYQRADASLARAGAAWSSLFRHHHTFVSCDDGALAEGYSDAVVSLLARRWDQFDAFVALSARDPGFRQWAIRHIDASVSTEDLKKVLLNAERCTGNARARKPCGEVARAAREALADEVAGARH